MKSLLMSVSLLMVGSGAFNTFIGLRSIAEGFSKEVAGLMMSAFYAGLILGSLRCGPLVNRIGHIRAFAAFSAVAAAAILCFPLVVSAPAWILLRGLIGFNIAGLYMVAESWLNAKTSVKNRGTLLSLYMMTTYLALGAGQLLINFGSPAGDQLFMLVAILLALSLVPVAITRATHPPPVETPHFGFAKLYRISPLAVMTCACAGLSLGALYGMGPIFAHELDLSVAEISLFMTVIVLGGFVLQFPVGRLSDFFDRRLVIVGVCGVAAVSSYGMFATMGYLVPDGAGEAGNARLWMDHAYLILGIAGIYGGIAATLYPLSVAYANDYIEPKDLVAASGGLVLAYGIGAAAGPVSAAAVMRLVGPAGLFLFTGTVAFGGIGFALYRMRRRAWAPVVEKEAFVALPETFATPVGTDVDPRAEEPALLTKKPRWRWILDRRKRIRRAL